MERKPLPLFSIVFLVIGILCLPFLLFNGCLLIGGGSAKVANRITGNSLHFEKPMTATSPDGKIQFSADSDGTLRLCDGKTGRLLQTHNEPPTNYRGVAQVAWPDKRRVQVTLSLRYAAMVNSQTFIWDSVTGAWHDMN